MENTLTQLKSMTVVVADTGDFASIRAYEPRDATTNPSLILKAIQQAEYRPLFEDAVKRAARSHSGGSGSLVDSAVDRVLIAFGEEILKIVPGRVSTEVDAALSFNTAGSIAKARELIQLYQEAGIGRERVLIKLASTWEGIMAAKVLEKEGIHCNMTLLFSMAQAVACAEAGATLISPFVGRILDWYQSRSAHPFSPADDPGVISVKSIFHYYKKYDYRTEVMGASFRNSGEILELAGCDLLTISPGLLEELKNSQVPVVQKLSVETAKTLETSKISLDESAFRWMLNEDQMATEKLSDGIRQFGRDMDKVRFMIREILS